MATPLRVLLVEDDNLLRELVRLNLERRGRFTVVGEAEDARTGVRMAAQLEPQLVLLDLVMPVMSGFEALPLIRRAAPESHIIVLSMLQRRGVKETVLSQGADAFLDKGLDGDELEKRVWELCIGRTITMADLMKPEPEEPDPPGKTLNAPIR